MAFTSLFKWMEEGRTGYKSVLFAYIRLFAFIAELFEAIPEGGDAMLAF